MQQAIERRVTRIGAGRRMTLAGWIIAFVVIVARPANAQLFERPTFIRDARIVTMAGPVVKKGGIIVKGGRIVDIGPAVQAPLLAKTIDASGKTVTPGLIDAWSSLGRYSTMPSRGDAQSTAWDGFERYATDDFHEALRQGVTTIYVGPHGSPGVTGTGVVVKLVPGDNGTYGKLLDDASALCIDLGCGQGAVARLKTFRDVRKAFRKALDYRKALEDYEEELKEYVKKLEERRKEEAKADKPEESENGDKKPEEKEDDKGEKDDDSGDDESPEPKPESAFHRMAVATRFADEPSNGDEEEEPGEEKEEDKGKEKKAEEELKKPTKPTPDRDSEVLLKAIDHEIVVRIRAQRSQAILNALELAEEFNLDIVLEGATEAYLLADELAEADVPVVLGQVARTELFENNAYRRHDTHNAARLEAAGVVWTVGSGAMGPTAARFVGVNAQLAARYGGGDWLRTVTTEAARVLGIDRKIARLIRGMPADLVIWSGDPASPEAVVEKVFVDGEVAYERAGR